MDRNRKPAIFAANEAVLEKQAQAQAGDGGPTSTTTTQAPTAPTTTKAPPAEGPTTTTTTTAGAQTTTTTTAGTQSTTTTAAAAPTAQSKDQKAQAALEYFRETTGNSELTLEDLPALLNRPKEETLTPEQKKIQEQQDLVALQKAFVDSGKGTVDDFHRIRTVAAISDEDLVREDFRKAAKEMNPKLTDAQIDDYFNHQYYLDPKAGHSEEEMEIGQKKLALEAGALRKRIEQPLTEVQEELKMNGESIVSAQEWRGKVKNFMQSTMPTKFAIPLGKVGETELGDFTYILSEDEHKEIAKSMEDPAYLLKSIADKTGKTDPQKLFDFIVWKIIGSRAAKVAGTEQYSKGLDTVQAKLDNKPNLTGTGDRRMEGDDGIDEGKKQIIKDADSMLGARMKPRYKKIGA